MEIQMYPPQSEQRPRISLNLTFDSLGGGQQQMVLRQNVSYDVYGTFCMESEGQTQQLTQTCHASHSWQETSFCAG